jgi:hypothetical protein
MKRLITSAGITEVIVAESSKRLVVVSSCIYLRETCDWNMTYMRPNALIRVLAELQVHLPISHDKGMDQHYHQRHVGNRGF